MDSPDGRDWAGPERSVAAMTGRARRPSRDLQPIPAGCPETNSSLVFHDENGRFHAIGKAIKNHTKFQVHDSGRWWQVSDLPAASVGTLSNLAGVRRARQQGGRILVLPFSQAAHGDAMLDLASDGALIDLTTVPTEPMHPAQAEMLRGARVVVGNATGRMSMVDLDLVALLQDTGVEVESVLVGVPGNTATAWKGRVYGPERCDLQDALEVAVGELMGSDAGPFSDLVHLETDGHLVAEFLPPGLCLMYAPPESGKSTLAAALVGAVISNVGEWAGRKTASGPCLVLCGEDRDGMHLRIQTWLNHYEHEHVWPCPVIDASMAVDSGGMTEFFTRLDATLAALQPRLLVMDTLLSLAPGLNENDASAMSALVGRLRDLLTGRPDLTVLLLHHPAKGKGGQGGPRGHSSLLGALDASIEVRKSRTAVTATVRKARNFIGGSKVAFRLVPSWGHVVAEHSPDVDVAREDAPTSADRILQVLLEAGPQAADGVMEATGLGRSLVYKGLGQLVTERLAMKDGKTWSAVSQSEVPS
jgi:hypothetical protein